MIENMSFVIFRFDDKDRDERKWYESAMLSLLNAEQNDYFKKQAETHDWLGNYVPQHIPENSKYTIRPKTSKLWVSQELDKQDTHIFAHDDIIFLNKKAKEDEQWDANKSYLKVIK